LAGTAVSGPGGHDTQELMADLEDHEADLDAQLDDINSTIASLFAILSAASAMG
jgi:hypothetical protein